jgi:hypothetical protein
LGSVRREPGEADIRGVVAFVGEVICLAGEAVNERYRIAKSGRQKQRGDREIFVVVYRHLWQCTIHVFSMD